LAIHFNTIDYGYLKKRARDEDILDVLEEIMAKAKVLSG
jgi:hypothetical protein